MLVSLTVGKVDAGVAVLLTEDKRLIEFPSILLPSDISSGSIVDVNVTRNAAAESQATKAFQSLQSQIFDVFGSDSPSPPVLRCRNATQTSVVLEWDPIALATASLRSLSLYRNGSKAGTIPRPLEMTSTKISGLAVDTEYTFYLVLKTSAGTYSSEKLTIKTHKMTDLSGITITPGLMPRELREDVESTVERMGAKVIEQVRIDTTHFVCTEGRGSAWEKAMDMNIPVVLPDWVKGCEKEGRLVGVRGYYLTADPRLRQMSQVGPGSSPQRSESQQSVPQQQRPMRERQISQGSVIRTQPTPRTEITPPTPEMQSGSSMETAAKINGRESTTPPVQESTTPPVQESTTPPVQQSSTPPAQESSTLPTQQSSRPPAPEAEMADKGEIDHEDQEVDKVVGRGLGTVEEDTTNATAAKDDNAEQSRLPEVREEEVGAESDPTTADNAHRDEAAESAEDGQKVQEPATEGETFDEVKL